MADFSALKTSIQNYIKQNGNEEITGNLLQQILLSMVTTLGDSAINDLVTALNAEIANRGNADTELGNRITSEAEARVGADNTLRGLIDGITDNIENGYVYAGIATPSTTPASGKVFYLALTAGTYTNFGATVVSQGINILKYNGSAWSLDSFLGLDDAPTQGSNNLVKSGGVLDSIIKDGSAFDLSAYNNGTTYADLSAALTALNALPAVYKKGGMSIKYVQSSDNKYIQARCMAQNFTTDVTQWQGVDSEPTAGSRNLVESGGVYNAIPLLYQKTVSYSHTSKGGKTVAKGFNLLSGHEYKIDVDGTNETGGSFTAIVRDKNNANIFTISNIINAGGSVSKTFIPEQDYIGVQFYSYFNGTTGTVIYSVEDISEQSLRNRADACEDGLLNVKGGVFTKSITSSGSGHSSETNLIPVSIKAGEKFYFEINPGTAVVRDIHLYIRDKDKNVIFSSDSLAANKRYEFTANANGYYIGVYFVNTTPGTISWTVICGEAYLLDNINRVNEKAIRVDMPQSFTDVEREQAYKNLCLPILFKRTVSYTNTVSGNQTAVSNLNFQKGKEYRITVDTTAANNTSTLNVVDSNNTAIKTLSNNISKGVVNEYDFIPENDYVNAKLRGYINGTGSTIVYSVEEVGEGVLRDKVNSIFPYFENTFSVSTGGHSSNNNRLTVDIKKGTCAKIRVEPVTATLNPDTAIYATTSGGEGVTLVAAAKVNTDIIIVSKYDIVSVGAYFTTTKAGTVRLAVDNSSYVSDKYILEELASKETMEAENQDAFIKLNAAVTKYGHYGEHTEKKYISLLMMTDSHADWARVNRCFTFGENDVFDAILHGGDIVEGSGGFASYDWKAKVLASSKPVLAITGNHEHQYVAGQTMYVGLTDEEVHNLLYDNDLVDHNGEIHPTINNVEKNYYYKDITKDGITTRIIALYQFEWNSPVDGEGHPIYGDNQGKDRVFYTQEQIDWLVNTLKDTPDDVGVVLFSHIPVSASKYLDNGFVVPERRNTIHKDVNFLWSFMSNKTFLYSIINAWVNGGVCNISSAQTTPDSVEHPLSVDTTFDGGGRFIANICGHQHAGGFAYMVDDSDNTSPFRVVISPTTNATYVQNSGWWGRAVSGFTQDCLNCIVYDYDRDKVKVVRFGSNINNDGIECKSYCF